MPVRTRRVWRVSPGTLTAVWVFVLLAGLGVPALAVLAFVRAGETLIAAFLLVLAVAAVVYGWRFGLHPRLIATAEGLEVVNPGRLNYLSWDELTVIAPGENGLILGTEQGRTEAWCVQKSKTAIRRGRTTRADGVVAELEDLRDHFDPPLEDEQTGLRIRRGRQADVDLLTSLERSAAEAGARRGAEPEPAYPTAEVRRRWHRLLRDRRVHVRVLEEHGQPAGLVAWDTGGRLRHLAVAPAHTRHGHGSLLLQYATEELMAGGAAELSTWLPESDTDTRGFYRSRGWRDTDERRDGEVPDQPGQIQMLRTNPRAPRRRA